MRDMRDIAYYSNPPRSPDSGRKYHSTRLIRFSSLSFLISLSLPRSSRSFCAISASFSLIVLSVAYRVSSQISAYTRSYWKLCSYHCLMQHDTIESRVEVNLPRSSTSFYFNLFARLDSAFRVVRLTDTWIFRSLFSARSFSASELRAILHTTPIFIRDYVFQRS